MSTRSWIAGLFLFTVADLSFAGDVPEFSEPCKGLKNRVAEHYLIDADDPTLEVFQKSVTETFNEVGDLISRVEKDANHKTVKRVYKHNYDANGLVLDRQEKDGAGNVLRTWKYDWKKDGSLKITVTVAVQSDPEQYLYEFDKRGALISIKMVNAKEKNPPSTTNTYSPEGQITEQVQKAGTKVKRTVKFEYGEDKKLKRRVEYDGSDGDIAVDESYNTAGDSSTREVYDHYGMEVVERTDHEYKYDDSNRLSEDYWYYQKIWNHKLKTSSGRIYYKYEKSE